MSDQRNIAAIVLSLAIVQIGVGALGVYVPLTLHDAGVGAATVGAVVALYGVGFLLGLVIGPRLVAQVGHIRAFTAFVGLTTALALFLYINVEPGLWALLRLLAGFAAAGVLTAGENWIADIAPEERRGTLVGVYKLAGMFGFLLGPVALGGVAVGGAGGLMIAAAAFALCLTPLALTQSSPAATPSEAAATPRVMLQATPSAFIAALMTGAVNGAVLGLAPIYASRFDPDDPVGVAVSFQVAILIGGLLAQFPIGAASDSTDRRRVLFGLAGVVLVASIVFVLLPANAAHGLVMLLAALFGAGALSIHGVAAAHAADRAGPGAVAGMVGGVLVTAAFGMVVGPLIAGVVMETAIGARGLFVFTACVMALLAFVMVRRRATTEPISQGDKKPFAAAPVSSLAVIELDPRATLDLQANRV